MAADQKVSVLQLRDVSTEDSQSEQPEREVRLQHGRSLAITSAQNDDSDSSQTIELRAESGQVELRIRVTEDGPVLCVDGVRLSVAAADDIELRCKAFRVDAAESVAIESQGKLEVSSQDELHVQSKDDVRVRGKLIYLN